MPISPHCNGARLPRQSRLRLARVHGELPASFARSVADVRHLGRALPPGPSDPGRITRKGGEAHKGRRMNRLPASPVGEPGSSGHYFQPLNREGMVWMAGFEPAFSRIRTARIPKLSHIQ